MVWWIDGSRVQLHMTVLVEGIDEFEHGVAVEKVGRGLAAGRVARADARHTEDDFDGRLGHGTGGS